ncbi:MAG: hypothetical protein IPM98_01280 [Lewinellaceae bacterium]|nr:hypothetical protein [Lewinellaceae bacterium]
MPLPKPLATLQQDLRDQLVDDLAGALKALQTLLPPGSEKHQTATMLLGKLNDTNKARLRGTISNEALQLAYNQLRSDLLDLIDGLLEADFEAATAAVPEAKKAQQGEILYRIPDAMPLGRETRCIVRIALDADAIVENITLDEYVTLKPLTRVSDLMQVELLDPGKDPAFEIRSISSAEQFVEEEGYTEWLFQVMPVRAGTFPLLIKVSVIELVLGKERKKEIVLEEAVLVSADLPAAPDAPLKSTGEKLKFAGSEDDRSGSEDVQYADSEFDADQEIPQRAPAASAPVAPPGSAGSGIPRPSSIYIPRQPELQPQPAPAPAKKPGSGCLMNTVFLLFALVSVAVSIYLLVQ